MNREELSGYIDNIFVSFEAAVRGILDTINWDLIEGVLNQIAEYEQNMRREELYQRLRVLLPDWVARWVSRKLPNRWLRPGDFD